MSFCPRLFSHWKSDPGSLGVEKQAGEKQKERFQKK